MQQIHSSRQLIDSISNQINNEIHYHSNDDDYIDKCQLTGKPNPLNLPWSEQIDRGEILYEMKDELNCDMASFPWAAMAIYWTLRWTMRAAVGPKKKRTVLMKGKEPRGEQLITAEATENLLMADLLPTKKKIKKNKKNKENEENKKNKTNESRQNLSVRYFDANKANCFTNDWLNKATMLFRFASPSQNDYSFHLIISTY